MLFPLALEFLPRGRDYNAGVYRVVSEQGTVYLLKVTARSLYEPSCLVPRYLRDHGITTQPWLPFPLKIVFCGQNSRIGTVIVYPFIDGDSSLMGMTNEQWKEVGSIFKQIHQMRLQPSDFPSLRTDTFDPTKYARWVHTFETQYLSLQHGGSDSSRSFRASWIEHQSTIHTAVTSLEKLAVLLQGRAVPYVICHADLHARNLIRDRAGHVFVIDWDEVMLAPKERDFIFIRESQADAFWEGYGQKEIDWMLLSYFLWERVVQDVIEEAQNVCFRDDLAEETKMDIARSFHESLSSRGQNLGCGL